MRLIKYLVTFGILGSFVTGCYVEERRPRHPHARHHDTIIIRDHR